MWFCSVNILEPLKLVLKNYDAEDDIKGVLEK